MPIHFEILDPSGAVVPDSQLEGVTDRGRRQRRPSPFPRDCAGGEYTLVARSLDEAFPEEKRTFFVRRYRLPRLKKELEFARDSYAPGDTVVADFLAERAEGGPAAGAPLRIIATVDGQAVYDRSTPRPTTPAPTRSKFKLPEKIERGDGQLGRGRRRRRHPRDDRQDDPHQPRQGRGDVLSRGGRPGGRPGEPRLLRRPRPARRAGPRRGRDRRQRRTRSWPWSRPRTRGWARSAFDPRRGGSTG